MLTMIRSCAKFLRAATLASFALLMSQPARAEVTLPTILGSHMVLQRDVPCPIWGWAEPGEVVTVEFAGQQLATKADGQGNWLVRLQPLKASAEPQTLTVRGKNTVALEDILVGEVWICSGQSNMEWTVRESHPAEEFGVLGAYPQLRHIKIDHTPAFEPQKDVPSKGGWTPCTPQYVGGFTAVGYYFARRISEELGVPVGLIGANWGGLRIEPWIPPVGFRQVPELKQEYTDKLATYPLKIEHYHQTPLAVYNGMIHPLLPVAIRGALWYQGESNNGEGLLYFEKMKALIAGWRAVWGNPDLPFYYVQLAPFENKGDPTKLAELWEAQTAALTIPHTGMVVTNDIGNLKNIHPKNKHDVGRRLALWALAKTYGQSSLVYSGPLYKEARLEGRQIRISFDHVGSGLVARDGQPLTWFQIAGTNGKFIEAQAEIDGDTVVVHSDSVTEPKFVRFAWSQLAQPNLANKEGLPASAFRSGK